jgi:hypothetical protein
MDAKDRLASAITEALKHTFPQMIPGELVDNDNAPRKETLATRTIRSIQRDSDRSAIFINNRYAEKGDGCSFTILGYVQVVDNEPNFDCFPRDSASVFLTVEHIHEHTGGHSMDIHMDMTEAKNLHAGLGDILGLDREVKGNPEVEAHDSRDSREYFLSILQTIADDMKRLGYQQAMKNVEEYIAFYSPEKSEEESDPLTIAERTFWDRECPNMSEQTTIHECSRIWGIIEGSWRRGQKSTAAAGEGSPQKSVTPTGE